MASSGKRSSILSHSSKISAVSPNTVLQKKGSVSAEKIEPFPPANYANTINITAPIEGDVLINTKRNSAEVVSRPELRFKSWKTGTLITPNGEPAHRAGLAVKPLPPPPTVTSPLSATSPMFVPATPTRPQGPQKTATYPSAASSVEKIKSMFSNRHHTPPDSPSPVRKGPYDSSLSPTPTRSPGTAVTIPSPRYGSPLPIKAPRTFLARADRERKDVVIKSTGVTRNVVRITERYLPNGLPYRNFGEDFKPEKYDLVKDVTEMSEKERVEFWNKQNVEIIIDFRGEENKENVDAAKKDMIFKGKEISKLGEKEGIVAMMELLGPDFASYTKHFFITMYFPIMNGTAPPKPTEAMTNDADGSHTAPKKLPATVAVTQAIVNRLHDFSSLEKLEINLRTPANSKTPLSIDALDHLLPFYDLSFTGWEVRWQTDYMSRSEPVRGWPISYLDREYNKILWDREKKAKSVQEAVFVTKSVAHLIARPRDGSAGSVAEGR